MLKFGLRKFSRTVEAILLVMGLMKKGTGALLISVVDNQ